MREPKNLEQYEDLPDDHLLNSTEVGKLFGAQRCSVSSLVRTGYIPKCDKKKKVTVFAFNNQRKTSLNNFWTLGLIRSIGVNDV